MSQSTTSNSMPPGHHADAPPKASEDPSKRPLATVKSWAKPCAVMYGGAMDGPLICGKALGVSTDTNTSLLLSTTADTNPWMGFQLEFPLDPNNEDEGFGIRFQIDRSLGMYGLPRPTEKHRVVIKFPRCQFVHFFQPLDASRYNP
ncbi:hypothetical protein QBC33DRAFT_614807 [Phialemonium atrogriseum]|uniref:Uncharacterized protein n=1 Tax=Phialemonium atrogriseum TaxID=1093897 RepID=A0AAJ0C9R9_9PEZI|nr:uncharacterized protein QBC33DRAFT_614807 [Phialemonium atrogriseum]KAK1772157.1 hypothetical protein QBC33DRAFT_614807 [Phialemonium atrogriseum]